LILETKISDIVQTRQVARLPKNNTRKQNITETFKLTL